jgi:2-iminobutanoate/2-iminopropanoate deaminase
LNIFTQKYFIKKVTKIGFVGLFFLALNFFSPRSAFADSNKPLLKVIQTSKAPKAIGPFSQAIVLGNLIFCSGSIPLNPISMKIETTDIESQTEQVIKNMLSILEASGSGLNKVLKTTVFLKDMNDFQKMNAVYSRLFKEHAPARSTVQVVKLPLDALVEIEAIASL